MIPDSLYNQFKDWIKSSDRWGAFRQAPKNNKDLPRDMLFLSFLQTMNINPTLFGVAQEEYDSIMGVSQPSQLDIPLGPEQPVDYQFPTDPWVRHGLTKAQWQEKFPDEAEEYEIEKSARKLGMTPLDYRRKIMGLSTTEEDKIARERFALEKEQFQYSKGLQERKFGAEQAQIGTEYQQNEAMRQAMLKFNIRQSALQSQMASAGASQANIEAESRRQFSQQFEDYRRTLEQSPRNFFRNQLIRATPNPFTTPPSDVGNEISLFQEAKKDAEANLKESIRRFKDVASRVVDESDTVDIAQLSAVKEEYDEARSMVNIARDPIMPLTDKINALRRSTITGERAVVRNEAGQVTYTGADPRGEVISRDVPMVNVPQKIQPFLSGAGERIPAHELFSRELLTPSGQALGRLKPSELDQLYGLAEVRGKDPRDLLGEVEETLPQIRRGSRTTPFRQR